MLKFLIYVIGALIGLSTVGFWATVAISLIAISAGRLVQIEG